MKYWQYIFLCLVWILNVYCENKRVKVLYAKPKALGKPLELGIVVEDSIWQGRQGTFWKKYIENKQKYTCLHILPQDTPYFVGLHRNLIHLKSGNKAGKLHYVTDQRAFGQITIYAPIQVDSLYIDTLLAFIWKQEKQRMRDYKYAFEASQATPLEKWISKNYPFRVRVLPDYQVYKKEKYVLCLKSTRGVEKFISISKQKHIFDAHHVIKEIYKKGYYISITQKVRTVGISPLEDLEWEALFETFELK